MAPKCREAAGGVDGRGQLLREALQGRVQGGHNRKAHLQNMLVQQPAFLYNWTGIPKQLCSLADCQQYENNGRGRCRTSSEASSARMASCAPIGMSMESWAVHPSSSAKYTAFRLVSCRAGSQEGKNIKCPYAAAAWAGMSGEPSPWPACPPQPAAHSQSGPAAPDQLLPPVRGAGSQRGCRQGSAGAGCPGRGRGE